MKTKNLWLSWLYCYVLCTVLGFIPNPTGFFKFLFVVAAIGFFVPGFLLLKSGQRKDQKLVLTAAAVSLGLTVLLIILNFASALLPRVWGTVMYAFLVIFSTPMICAQYWVLSLFGWACVLFAAISALKK